MESIWKLGDRTAEDMEPDRWFDEIYDSTKDQIFRYIYIHLDDPSCAEDVFQEVYTALYTRILRRGTADIRNPAAFLMKSAKREIWRLGRRKHHGVPIDEVKDVLPAPGGRPEDLAAGCDTLAAIRQAVREMPPRAARVFVLYYLFDLSLGAIASELGITAEAAKSRLSRARNHVRRILTQEEES